MAFICDDCKTKIFSARSKAEIELVERFSKGEKAADLLEEYMNEKTGVSSTCERYWVLEALIVWCRLEELNNLKGSEPPSR